MRRFWNRLRTKIYFIPALFCLLALGLTLLVCAGDRLLYPTGLHEVIPVLYQSTVPARDLLGVLTGALLTMITVSFSTIMVVLTLYSGQFSPRTLQNFLQSKISLRVLGTFMGTFIYAVTQLVLLPDPIQQERTLTATLGVLLALFCLVLFAYFIHHIAHAIQVDLMVEDITRGIFSALEHRRSSPPVLKRGGSDEEKPDPFSGEPVQQNAREIGYLQNVDTGQLVELAQKAGAVIRLECSQGEYLTKETELLTIWSGGTDWTEEQLDEMHKTIEIGEDRDTENDVEYGIIKLVEVALRAMSPGINDPNTAILCIQKIGFILAEIARSGLHRSYYFDGDGDLRLIVSKIPFGELLYRSFSQIRHYLQRDWSILEACVRALLYIARLNSPDMGRLCWRFSLYLLEGIDLDSIPSLDHAHLEQVYTELAAQTGQSDQHPFHSD